MGPTLQTDFLPSLLKINTAIYPEVKLIKNWTNYPAICFYIFISSISNAIHFDSRVNSRSVSKFFNTNLVVGRSSNEDIK